MYRTANQEYIINIGYIYGSLDCRNQDLEEIFLPDVTLYELNCSNNLLKRLPELPYTLIELYCQNNFITDLPCLDGLSILDCDWDQIMYTPSFRAFRMLMYEHVRMNYPNEDLFYYRMSNNLRRVAATIIQRNFKWYLNKQKFRKSIHVIKIQRACHNWLWKPICKDRTYGINLRLGLRELNDGTVFK